MLYVFHVDTGTMLTLDINLALESVFLPSVTLLKDAIEKTYHIPAEKQVLLVSGGENLEPTSRVCRYSAGTDTNPIYLFSKCIIEREKPPSPSIDIESDMDLKLQVENSMILPATYNTVVVRAQLAQQINEMALDQTRICKRLVHDQHLQQQGWAAVVANLEDITAAFRNRAEIFEQSFNQYLQTRSEFIELLENYKEDLAVLAKIPMIPALLVSQEDAKMEEPSTSQIEEDKPNPKTLLEWISSKDNQCSLEQVADMCSRGLEQFKSSVFEELKSDVDQALLAANNQGMKEIKGLEERLSGLEQLMHEVKTIMREQGDLAKAFLQNQNRASHLGDASILPDLCASHCRQLAVMLKNDQQLLDIRRRCTLAKEELNKNLHARLRWVMYVESRMSEMDSKLMIYHENLRRLRRSLEVVQQIHLTPQMYLTAVGEVVRRRTFSQAFLTWASDFAAQLLAIHNEEVARRKDFQTQFEGHFLNTLFPGMEDFPPAYGTQAPSAFDSKLPKLCVEDLEQLQTALPEFQLSMYLPDLGTITQFFLIRSHKTENKEETIVPTLLQPVEGEEPSPSPISLQEPPPAKDQDRGFESETDTEEFEKVGQSPVKQSSGDEQTAGAKEGVVATLEENLGNTRDEVERLRKQMLHASHVVQESTLQLRDEVSEVRSLTVRELESIQSRFQELTGVLKQHWAVTRTAEEMRRSELLQRLTVDHELEMEALKQEVRLAAEAKDEDIKKLRQALELKEREMAALRVDMEHRLEEEVRQRQEVACSLEKQLNDTRQQCCNLQQRLDAAEEDKQRTVKDMQDRLSDEYKTEMEGLRSRFRLMANASMERSPSDSSLEKIERPGVIELVNHEAVLAQMREDMVAEREGAVKEALEIERRQWETRLEQELKQARCRSEAEKQVWFNEAMRRVVGENQRQVEALKAREASLVAECRRHQDTIRRLTDDRETEGASRSLDSSSSGPRIWPLLDRMERLETERRRLENALIKERNRKSRTLSETAVLDSGDEQKQTEMSSSVAIVQGAGTSRDVATSPEPLHRSLHEEHLREKLTKSANSLIQQGKINIGSCNIGDVVLVVWDQDYRNYTIFQDTATLYFLHSDCLDTLGLRPSSDGSPRKHYTTGEVIDKEYCHAKKSENRYRVPKGTKFYRVKVRPLQKEMLLVRSRHHHHQQQAGASGSANC